MALDRVLAEDHPRVLVGPSALVLKSDLIMQSLCTQAVSMCPHKSMLELCMLQIVDNLLSLIFGGTVLCVIFLCKSNL